MKLAYKSLFFACLVSLVMAPGCVFQRTLQVFVQQPPVGVVAQNDASGSIEHKVIKKGGKWRRVSKKKTSSGSKLFAVLSGAYLWSLWLSWNRCFSYFFSGCW